MDNVDELMRLPSPAPRPQSLAFDGASLWMGSLETRRIYAIDPATWNARDEGVAPGIPYGMTVAGEELFVICGADANAEDQVRAEDERIVRRFLPGHGFKNSDAFLAPDGTGSQLAWDGDVLYISQWYNKKILGVDKRGGVLSTIEVPHGICGQVIVDGRFYLVTTDDEDGGPYWLTRVDARGDMGAGEPECEDLAIIPFPARALAYDGKRFWTNHRAADQIVAFARV